MHVILNEVKYLLFNRTQKQILRRLAPQNDRPFYFACAIAILTFSGVNGTERKMHVILNAVKDLLFNRA